MRPRSAAEIGTVAESLWRRGITVIPWRAAVKTVADSPCSSLALCRPSHRPPASCLSRYKGTTIQHGEGEGDADARRRQLVDRAIAAHVARMKHLATVDEWLEELEHAHGPIPPETLEWAGQLIDDWARRSKRRKAG